WRWRRSWRWRRRRRRRHTTTGYNDLSNVVRILVNRTISRRRENDRISGNIASVDIGQALLNGTSAAAAIRTRFLKEAGKHGLAQARHWAGRVTNPNHQI